MQRPLLKNRTLSRDFIPFKVKLGEPSRKEQDLASSSSPQRRLFNRDLSWLQFNNRVLSEAENPEVPSLERLRFATIVSSNLDEFFMVRVAEISRIARQRPTFKFPDGMTASQVLTLIRERVLDQKARQAAIFERILKALRQEGICIYDDFDLDHSLDQEIQDRMPVLYICRRKSSEALPQLPSARIHVFVRFAGHYTILSIEKREARLLELSPANGALRYALLERWLSARASRVFPEEDVIEAFPFKVIRDADLRYHPEDEDSLEDQIVDAVHKRQMAKAVRLEVDAPAYSDGALFLATALGLDSAGLYRFNMPLDLRTLALIYNAKGGERLRYPAIEPKIPPPFRDKSSCFDAIRRREILLHHPYDSFDIVVRFLEAAAADSQTTHLYHTLYRTTWEAPTMRALREAANRGKKSTAYVEIKARFDELNNLRWAEELRQSGVQVVRPLGRYKVHSKLILVSRREGKKDVRYLHLGTGNYHPVTARQYTDLGLLTCDETLGREVTAYFEALSSGKTPSGFRELMVAPGNLHGQMLRLIQEETRIQRKGGSGFIMAKMNSLVDPNIIEALYKASSAGVKIELLVRGICCLIPGVKGLSENIQVVSIIDRFLEHSRIYYFRAGGEEKLYLSSADWMPRNFYTRYEIAFPVKDPILKVYIRGSILGNAMADNVKAWQLRPDGSYAKVRPGPEGKELRSQEFFEALAKKDYRDTVLEHR